MTARRSRLLVVDASVVQSAGETDPPVSSACRETLLAVLNICHRVAITKDILDEWNRHMSRFSRKWLRSMAPHRKPPKNVNPHEVDVNTTDLSDSDRAAIEKDLHLIKAALSADRIIVTRDDDIMDILAKPLGSASLTKSIRWINPVRDGASELKLL
jgi:hypothetical protein